jgi:anaphase-promoting complex subunit 5
LTAFAVLEDHDIRPTTHKNLARMSRYLTPSKVALLVLISTYSSDVVAKQDRGSVLSFIITHILPDHKHPSNLLEIDAEHVVSADDFEHALSPLNFPIPGRSVWDYFLQKMWSFDCFDTLDLFLSDIPVLLSRSREQILRDREAGEEEKGFQGHVSRTSPLGAFIRRCHLEYTRLQFQDGTALWQDFIGFRISTRQAWEKKNPPDGKSALDINLSMLHIDSSHPLSQIMYSRLTYAETKLGGFSTHDVEKLMEFQVSELQRLGGRLPEPMKVKLKQLSASGITLPSLAHYLRFLDSWRAGDYAAAFDNLHRYFDYTMQSRDRTFYQYALLNLAILQADFGCHSEAIPAMQEAIATARENKDTTCLNFCMSWLYHFGKAFPTEMKEIRESGILGSEMEGLAFLKTRAKDAEMWGLLSTCLLSEAKMGLQHGDSLASVFESIAKASHLNVTKGVTNVVGPTLLMKGSVYGRIGITQLAWLSGETFLECYSSDAPAEDILKCKCRLASLLVQRGRYKAATEMMDSVSEHIKRVLKYNQYWTFYMGMLKLRRYIHRHDIDAASYMLQQLKGQGAPDLEVNLTLSILEIDLLLRRGTLDSAIELMDATAEKAAHENADIVYQSKLLSLKARGLAKCGHPLKGFSMAVRAANIAFRARILPALWEAIGTLANILLEVKEYEAACSLLESIVPQATECQDCDLTGRMYSLLVDAHMGLAGQADGKSAARKDHVNMAMDFIECAYEQFRRVEDLKGQTEMLAKKATIMHWRGDLVLANDTASQYLQLKGEYKAREVLAQG